MGKHHPPFTIGSLIILALLLTSLNAEAAGGEIKGLTVTPPTIPYGGTATILIDGKDVCGKLMLTYGDGKSLAVFNAPLPKSVTHTYTMSGSFPVMAQAVSNCKGEAGAILTVQQGPLDQLCGIINCGAFISAVLTPKIDSVFAVVMGGGHVLVGGSGFGSSPGKLLLKFATGPVVELKNLEWYPTGVGGTIPPEIHGLTVSNLAAKLQIVNQYGKPSNEWPVTFLKETKLLPMCDVKVVSCGTDDTRDSCNTWQDPDDDFPYPWDCAHWWQEMTIEGHHWKCLWCGYGHGTDAYELKLANGWLFHHWNFYISEDNGAHIDTPYPSLPGGGTIWTPQVYWRTNADTGVIYHFYVYIVGPRGVPHK